MLFLLLLIAIFGESMGDYTWGSSKCEALIQANEKLPGTGCVEPGSIVSDYPNCKRCVFNFQCESNWCVNSWKLCYESGKRCAISNIAAGCNSCSSSKTADLSKCECDDPDFPNNWVQCTDGIGYDTYETGTSPGYVRQENWDGSLSADDPFAANSVCFHNKFREDAAGLRAVSWNNELAAFATEWANTLKETNECRMYHSPSSDRKNLGGHDHVGENLYWKWTCGGSGGIPENDIPKHGKWAAEAWYSEMLYYQFPGPNNAYDMCGLRNTDIGKPQIGHLTQMLWADTTEIGCDYAICNNGKGESIVVACVYGPGGNYQGQPAFDERSYCKLKEWEGNEEYGGLPRCDGKDDDCESVLNGNTDNGNVGNENNDNAGNDSAKDGKCKGKWGGTCKFPWSHDYLGTYESCQDSVDKLNPHEPWCETDKPGYFDQCVYDESDPDCIWHYP